MNNEATQSHSEKELQADNPEGRVVSLRGQGRLVVGETWPAGPEQKSIDSDEDDR